MSTPLLEKLNANGIRIAVAGGELKVTAPRDALTPELVAELKARKAEVLADLDRTNKTPPGPLPLAAKPDLLTQADVDLICRAIDPQPVPVFHWILADGEQADRYERERHFKPRDANMTAACDLLLWQHEHRLNVATRAERVAELLAILKFESKQQTTKGNTDENQGTEDERT